MKRVAIIGAGISGLTAANLLNEKGYDVVVYEKQSEIGGIARTKLVNGQTYHLTGGHCFNSKHIEVLDFVFNKVLNKDKWNLIERKSKIQFENYSLEYPIEFSIRKLAEFDEELAVNIISDFIGSEGGDFDNLHDWFIGNFGRSLAESYFIPYNSKIWRQDLKKMSPDWVKDKIPMPNKTAFIKSLISLVKDEMPHRYFYYPKTNNQFSMIESLASPIKDKIRFNSEISSLIFRGDKWIVNSDDFDYVVCTAPLNHLGKILSDHYILELSAQLRYNRVTTMLWENRQSIKETWTYIPSDQHISHRHIHIGNFMLPVQDTTIVEAIGEYTYDAMIEEGSKFEYLGKSLDYHVSDHAYVIFDDNYRDTVSELNKRLTKYKGFYSVGRFGEWEYYNMDVCMKSVIDLVDEYF